MLITSDVQPPPDGCLGNVDFVRGSTAGMYTFGRQPGVYAYVNHNLIEPPGGRHHFVVEGEGGTMPCLEQVVTSHI
jgi:hypothetical protein